MEDEEMRSQVGREESPGLRLSCCGGDPCWHPLKGARQDLLQALGLDRAQGRLLPLGPTLGQAPH